MIPGSGKAGDTILGGYGARNDSISDAVLFGIIEGPGMADSRINTDI
jgi:hypothetical protein